MKKKIIIGLTIFSLLFFLGGIYIIVTIEKATSTLDNLITLHQVEILREHLLIHIKRVQGDLNLQSTRFARSVDTMISNVKNMENMAVTCFACHHSEDVQTKLVDLRNELDKYKDALSRVLTIRANDRRLAIEEDIAFRIGEDLIKKVNIMIKISTIKLDKKTNIALRDISDTKIILYLLVAIGPILTAILGFVFVKSITRPVNVLLDATRRLEGGDLDFRIEGLQDEFGRVASSFNEMANSLKDQMHKMQRTEQMIVLGELAAGLVHEIKNPLAGIKVSVEVMTEDENISKEDKESMLKVIEEINRIESLLKGLLNFAKPPKPQFMSVDLNDILYKTIDFSLRHLSLKSQGPDAINVMKDLGADLPEIMADTLQLQQAFLNLLLNAVDAMPYGGTMGIKTYYNEQDNSIKVEISDTGKGIDEAIMNKIFQPFVTTKSKGTGLGLAITKRLIEQQGGEIRAENNKGGGTMFKIILPIKQKVEEKTA
jgi:signal transduction histidine kinase